MNAYEQLVAVKDELAKRGARPKTLRTLDGMIAQAESQRDNPMSVTPLMILRHVLRAPAVLNDEEIYLDVLALQGDLEEESNARPEPNAAYTSDDRRPKLKSFYKQQKKRG